MIYYRRTAGVTVCGRGTLQLPIFDQQTGPFSDVSRGTSGCILQPHASLADGMRQLLFIVH